MGTFSHSHEQGEAVIPKLKGKVAITAAALVALAGAGGTYAATQGSGSSERQLFLNDVAKRLHVSTSDLNAAFSGALSDRLDAAVKAGRLTREQADAIKQHQKQEGGLPFLGPAPHFGGPPHGAPIMAGIDAASKYLGLTDEQLHQQLESGKSLAQVASDRGKSLDGLKSAIKDAVRSKLDTAVSEKRLTKAQEQQILDDLERHVDDIVQRKGDGPPPGDRHDGPHFRGRGGPPFGGPPWGARP
jgi:AraC-like DNA-binding protein